MKIAERVQQYYGDRPFDRLIRMALEDDATKEGVPLALDALDSLDELHCRGSQATAELAALAGLRRGMRVLDVGSGLGGPARVLAADYGVHVTGLEMTASYLRAARKLTERAGMSHRVVFEQGNALSAPFATDSFDCVWLQHVLVNVADKGRLFASLRRVLHPGGTLAIHEVVSPDSHGLAYPLPWAEAPSTSFLARPERLRIAIENAGFALRVWRDTTPLAAQWCGEMIARAIQNRELLGWPALIGGDSLPRLTNLARGLKEGQLGLVMAVFVKTGIKADGDLHARGRITIARRSSRAQAKAADILTFADRRGTRRRQAPRVLLV